MPTLVTVEIRPQDIDRMKAVLSPGQMKRAMYQAVSRTLRRVVWPRTGDGIGNKVESVLNVKRDVIRQSIKAVPPMKDSNPAAKVIITNNPLPMADFKGIKVFGLSKYGAKRKSKTGRRVKRGGVTVQMMKNKPAQTFRHAFAAWVASPVQAARNIAHYGIFERGKLHVNTQNLDTAAGTYTYFGTYKKDTKRTVKVVRRGKRWAVARLPIYELFGPSVYSLFAKGFAPKKFSQEQEQFIQTVLRENIDSQIRRFLKLEKDAPLPV